MATPKYHCPACKTKPFRTPDVATANWTELDWHVYITGETLTNDNIPKPECPGGRKMRTHEDDPSIPIGWEEWPYDG